MFSDGEKTMSIRIGTALAVIAAAAAAAPPAHAAKPKLYTVSLSGEVRSEITAVTQNRPPLVCEGTETITRRFVASAGLVSKPNRVPLASYGRLRFPLQLTSPRAESTYERISNFTPDPVETPADPSVCAIPPERRGGPCTFNAAVTRASGDEFALLPRAGKYELYYNRNDQIVSCEESTGESLLGAAAPLPTSLRESAVKRLAKGRSASASGTATAPPVGPGATGAETLTYTLKVKRVR